MGTQTVPQPTHTVPPPPKPDPEHSNKKEAFAWITAISKQRTPSAADALGRPYLLTYEEWFLVVQLAIRHDFPSRLVCCPYNHHKVVVRWDEKEAWFFETQIPAPPNQPIVLVPDILDWVRDTLTNTPDNLKLLEEYGTSTN